MNTLPKQNNSSARLPFTHPTSQGDTIVRKYVSRSIFFVISLAILLGARLQAQSDIWATAYYAGWMQGWSNNGHLPAQNIDYSAVTHIVHFSLVPQTNGTLNADANSITAINSSELVSRAHAAGKKVIISIGGWNSDVAFRSATSSANLNTFVANLVNFMKSRGYDGIDIDWEILQASDASQYQNFIRALRAELNKISPRPLLTAATAWQSSIFGPIANEFDQINIMSYDLSGAWSGWVTWHNSPIYDGGLKFPGTNKLVPSSNGMVESFIAAGVPASKLGIGIDFYGYVWSGGSGTPTGGATEPRQSWSTAPSVQSNVPYHTIMKNYYQPQYYRWDNVAQASYLSIDNAGSTSDKFISYDDETTALKKVEYARSKKIGGVIIWELGGGYRPELPAGQRDPLLQAVKSALGGSTPSLDTTPPTISMTAPSNGATLSGTITVSANAGDNVGVTGVQFKINGNNIGTEDVSAPFSVSLNTLTLLNGSFTISAMARDAAGNSSNASVSVNILNVTLDTTPPTISLTAPSSGATVSGTVSVLANASDNIGVAGVQFILNGANLGNEVTSPPYTASWNTTQVTNGSYTLSARARDAAGNTAQSSVTVTVSNTTAPPPGNSTELIAYDDALQSPWVNNSWSASTSFGSTEQKQSGTSSIKTTLTSAWGALSLHYGAWGSEGINPASYTGLEFAVYAPVSGTSLSIFFESDNGQTFPKVNTGTIAAGSWRVISVPMSQLNPNGITINRISIQEISGTTKTFYIDNLKFTGSEPAPTAPASPTLASPSNGSTNVGLNPPLTWNASTGASTYRIQVSTTSSFSTALLDQAGMSGTTFAASGLSNGMTYYWRVNATNASGTSGWSGTSSFATIASAPAPDTTKPTVSITVPANGGTVSGTVTLSANASDNVKLAGVQFKVNGSNQGAEVTASPYQTSWNTTQVANGSYTLTAVARDSAGNVQTATMTVTVANSVPAPSADNTVYDDALKSPWINSSWTATVTFNSTEQKTSGSSSIKVDQGAWGGLRFHNGAWGSAIAIDPSKYSAVSFAIHGGSVGISLGVFLANDQGQSFPAVKYVWVGANQWKTMTFAMSQLNPNNQTVHSLVIQDMSGRARTYYVDDIKFVSATQTLSKAAAESPEAEVSSRTTGTFELGQNYPNPFNPMTTIHYSLAAPANVKMEIFNMIGQRVELLVDRQQSSGSHQVSFNGSLLPSGVYFYRLTAQPMGENAQPLVIMKKMTLTK